MIDEYQDTNDVQEEFIAYISNNNVYIDLEMLIHIYLKINMIHIVRILMVLR